MEFKLQALASPGERGMEYAIHQRQKHRIVINRCTLSAARNGFSGAKPWYLLLAYVPN